MNPRALGTLTLGDVRMNSRQLLDSMLKTVQMGQIGIRSALKASMKQELRSELQSQLAEYDSIERQAHELATSRGWEMRDLDPALKGMANAMTRARLAFGNNNSKIAAMMIQGNTRGMILGYKNLHKHTGSDGIVCTLSQKLLDCEIANIRNMQGFL